MSKVEKPNRPFEWNYSQIQDDQLTWPHMFCQWLCIRLMEVYFNIFYTVRIIGRENKPKGFQSYVVACNHISVLDPPLVSLALDYQPISFMGKMELFEKPLMRLYNWGMSTFAVNREKLELSTVKSALKVLKTGNWALGIFPEGTRSKDGQAQQSKRGVAYFASTAKVPVMPLGIVCGYPKGSNGKGRKRLEIRIGEMIPCGDDMDALALRIDQAIQDLKAQGQADLLD